MSFAVLLAEDCEATFVRSPLKLQFVCLVPLALHNLFVDAADLVLLGSNPFVVSSADSLTSLPLWEASTLAHECQVHAPTMTVSAGFVNTRHLDALAPCGHLEDVLCVPMTPVVEPFAFLHCGWAVALVALHHLRLLAGFPLGAHYDLHRSRRKSLRQRCLHLLPLLIPMLHVSPKTSLVDLARDSDVVLAAFFVGCALLVALWLRRRESLRER